jgi:hypothetical protein
MGSLRYILIVILALCIGFAVGYQLEYQKVKTSETQIRGLMTEMENISRASREQLVKMEGEKGLYRLRVLVAEAQCDVMERNFGRASEQIDALEAGLEKAFAPLGDQGIEVRDNIRMGLGSIREGLQKLDVKVKVKIEDLAKALDQVMTK